MGKEFSRRTFLGMTGAACAVTAHRLCGATPNDVRPNIVWLVAEDMGPQLSCYGPVPVRTPHLDRMAAQGARYTQAFCTAPVCSASRSAFHTGMYQTAIGAHHHRSHRTDGYRLPEGVRLVSHRLREAGYFTSNATYVGEGLFESGKTDFNFSVEQAFDGVDWRARRSGQPFFAQINFREAHRGEAWQGVRSLPEEQRVSPGSVTIPPYYPDDPLVRQDLATYYDVLARLDERVGEVFARLASEGLEEKTLVFFFADNGACLVRGKQWLYEAGIHVPLLVRWPGRVPAGTENDRLVSLIDVSAATLSAAGLELPPSMQGRPFLSPETPPREYIVAARDRCDETEDRIRCIRTARFKYIRNYMPERAYTQPNAYIEKNYPVLEVLKRDAKAHTLTPAQSLFMASTKPVEELYDMMEDPHEIRNLSGDAAYGSVLSAMRERLSTWSMTTGDQGSTPEAARARELSK